MIFYRFLSVLFFPLISLYIWFRVYTNKEDKLRIKERFGTSSIARPNGDIIWLHAVSVGEANSSLILVEELLKTSDKISILFTTTTLTSAAVIASKLPNFKGRVMHQFLPIDSYFCVKKFLNFWKPKKVLFVESEIWPNLIYESQKSGADTFLVNARMSFKSSAKWDFARRYGLKVFNYFTAIFAQTQDDFKRLKILSEKEVFFFGNLKSQAQTLQCKEDELQKVKAAIGSRRMWLAASTHKGEEQSVIAAHNNLKKHFPDLLTILVIRHPNRAEEVKAMLSGINFAQRSRGDTVGSTTEFYLVDTLGELGLFYRLADFAFIGGSLLEIGGHNPFEAIKLDCAVISGRGVFNFREIYATLEQEKACVMIDSGNELPAVAEKFLQNKDVCKAMSAKASQLTESSNNIAQKLVAEILK